MEAEQKYQSQIARSIYTAAMSTMKFTLDMEERRYPDKGREDGRFKFFKKQLMRETYNNLEILFDSLEQAGVLEKTDNNECLKNGYKDTPSGGSGYVNSEKVDQALHG